MTRYKIEKEKGKRESKGLQHFAVSCRQTQDPDRVSDERSAEAGLPGFNALFARI